MRFTSLTLCLAVALSGFAAGKTVSYKADDSNAVRIVGRTLQPGDGSVTFDWSGVYAETKLKGTDLKMRVSNTGRSFFDIFIDGKKVGKIKSASADTIITIAEKLPNRVHDIAIRKCTEGETGRTTIHEFILPRGGQLTATEPRKRHIEFIGNSLSAGFGTEGKDRDQPFLPETENCNLAFSTIIPRYFDADYTIIAHSGRGAVRNWGDSVRISKGAMIDKMMQTFDEDSLKWDFSAGYRPDLVVINLGANDFSTEPHPYPSEFTGAYTTILNNIFANYGPDTKVMCVMPYAVSAPVENCYLDAINNSGKAENIRFIRMPVDYINATTDRGSVWHPNYSGQKKMAMLLIPYISTLTGWELEDKPIE